MRRVIAGIGVCGVTALVALQAQGRGAVLARQTWTIDGVARSALVSTPRGPAPATGRPLVVVFHGHGGTSANAARTFGIHDQWPEAVVVYPQGLPTPGQITDPQGLRPGWQHVAGDQRDRDLRFVDQMLVTMRGREPIDLRRVYAAGHSNGASMVYVLWGARADQFAAFAPSSSVFSRNVSNAKPKPAFVIAGKGDALVPYAAQMRSLEAMLRLNQANAKAARWEGALEIHRSPIHADVVAYLHAGGHQLPADSGALIVKFFKRIPAGA